MKFLLVLMMLTGIHHIAFRRTVGANQCWSCCIKVAHLGAQTLKRLIHLTKHLKTAHSFFQNSTVIKVYQEFCKHLHSVKTFSSLLA